MGIHKKRVVFICKIATGVLISDSNIEKIYQNSDLQLFQNEASYTQHVKF